MPVFRVAVLLAAALAVLLAAVALRAETTRLHYEISGYDTRAELLLSELREREIEVARLRNPALIRTRVAEFRLSGANAASKPAAAPASAPSKKPRSGAASPRKERP